MPGACSSRRATKRSRAGPLAAVPSAAATGSEDIADATERVRRIDEANDLTIDLESTGAAYQAVRHVCGIGPRAATPMLGQHLGASQLARRGARLQHAKA